MTTVSDDGVEYWIEESVNSSWLARPRNNYFCCEWFASGLRASRAKSACKHEHSSLLQRKRNATVSFTHLDQVFPVLVSMGGFIAPFKPYNQNKRKKIALAPFRGAAVQPIPASWGTSTRLQYRTFTKISLS